MVIGNPMRGLSGLWLNLVLISGMWGSSFLFIKLISNSVPPFSFAAARGFIAMAALLAWLILRKPPTYANDWRPRAVWGDFRHMVVLGTTNGWLANAMTVTALRYLDSAVVAIVLATVPLLVVLLTHFTCSEERFNVRWLVGVLTGFIGVFFVVGPLAVLGSQGSILGIVAMLVTAFSYACGTLYGRRMVGSDAVFIACGQQAVGAVIASIIGIMNESPELVTQPIRTWLLLIIIGVLCSALPTALYLRLLTRTTSVTAASIAFLQPVWAMALGWVVLSEQIGVRGLLGAVLIVLGILLTIRPIRIGAA
jgi:drug/metabolite transporter (DMT)-like permease